MTEEQLEFFSEPEPSRLELAFLEFHRKNPGVYELFKRFTFEAINSGRDNFGVGMIWERMRWYTQIETRGDPFKLNNNHRAYYGRLFMRDYPPHDGFFRTRKVDPS